MSSNFLEIDNATFAASTKNKVNNVSLIIKNDIELWSNLIKNAVSTRSGDKGCPISGFPPVSRP